MPPTAPCATASAGERPNTDTLPASGASSPSSMSIVVDLPAPLGPSSATVSPAAMRTSTPLTALIGPWGPWKDFTSARSSMSVAFACVCPSATVALIRSSPGRSFARQFDRLLALDLGEDDLARAHRHGRHLHRLVLAHELERLVEGRLVVGVQSHEHVGGGRAHVRQVLFFGGVDVEVVGACVLADDHAFVDLLAGADE